MKRSAFQQQEVISTESNQDVIDLKKIKLEEVSLPDMLKSSALFTRAWNY